MEEESQERKIPKTFGEAVRDAFKELRETFKAFVKAPKALWGINLPFVIEGLVYFGILTILGKFNSENVGLGDLQAGWVYSFVTGGITLAMVILGGYSDKIGARKSLALAFMAMVVGRVLVSISGTLNLENGFLSPMFFLMIAGLAIMVTGYGLYQPAAYAGVKRYTTPKTASMGYAVIYGLMNLGAFFSGFVSPMIRHNFESTFPPNGLTAVFWGYVILTIISLFFTLILITRKSDKEALERADKAKAEAKAKAEGDNPKKETKEKEPERKINNRPLYIYSGLTALFLLLFFFNYNEMVTLGSVSPEITFPILLALFAVGFVASIGEFLRHRPEHPFRDKRFVFFIFILIPVQTLFAHNWLTIPYYLDRAFTGSVVSEYFELFANINPILIFVLAPLVAGLTAKANVYKMMILGTFVMALPTFLLVIGPHIYLFLTYILLMSIGEAMWQPRFLQWIAEIAPEGKTGAYMGIGQLPWFLTKIITGLYSGYFVANYIPLQETGEPQSSGTMWLFHALIAMISPFALLLAKNWMKKGFKVRHEG